jgi:ketosteroid isomerase-like protein
MAVQKIRIKDKEGIGKYRYTRIYRKQNGGWHAVVMQATIVSTSN